MKWNNEKLNRRVDGLELSIIPEICLKVENIVYVGDLVQKSEEEMLSIPNFGRKSLNEVKEVLSYMGLSFGMNLSKDSSIYKLVVTQMYYNQLGDPLYNEAVDIFYSSSLDSVKDKAKDLIHEENKKHTENMRPSKMNCVITSFDLMNEQPVESCEFKTHELIDWVKA